MGGQSKTASPLKQTLTHFYRFKHVFNILGKNIFSQIFRSKSWEGAYTQQNTVS